MLNREEKDFMRQVAAAIVQSNNKLTEEQIAIFKNMEQTFCAGERERNRLVRELKRYTFFGGIAYFFSNMFTLSKVKELKSVHS